MARAYKSRVVLNRKAFTEIELAQADALFEVAKEVLAVFHPWDAPPHGQGLPEGEGAIAYYGRKKVGATQIGGRDVAKPRQLRLADGESKVAVGIGFPGRFLELGTVDIAADPRLTEAVNRVVPGAEVIISDTIKRRLAGMRA
jgi:hypothetical protein